MKGDTQMRWYKPQKKQPHRTAKMCFHSLVGCLCYISIQLTEYNRMIIATKGVHSTESTVIMLCQCKPIPMLSDNWHYPRSHTTINLSLNKVIKKTRKKLFIAWRARRGLAIILKTPKTLISGIWWTCQKHFTPKHKYYLKFPAMKHRIGPRRM